MIDCRFFTQLEVPCPRLHFVFHNKIFIISHIFSPVQYFESRVEINVPKFILISSF